MTITQERLTELNQIAIKLLGEFTQEEQLVFASRLLSGALVGYLYDNGQSAARSELYKLHHLIEAKLLKETIHREGH